MFAVGNAFGLSTTCLSMIYGVPVDVIDAEVEGQDNNEGSELTRRIALREGLDISLTIGASPVDTPRALRFPETGYDLVFLDGFHTDRQLFLDAGAITPYLLHTFVMVTESAGACSYYSISTGMQTATPLAVLVLTPG